MVLTVEEMTPEDLCLVTEVLGYGTRTQTNGPYYIVEGQYQRPDWLLSTIRDSHWEYSRGIFVIGGHRHLVFDSGARQSQGLFVEKTYLLTPVLPLVNIARQIKEANIEKILVDRTESAIEAAITATKRGH